MPFPNDRCECGELYSQHMWYEPEGKRACNECFCQNFVPRKEYEK